MMNIQITEISTDPPSLPVRRFRVIIDQPNDPVDSRKIIRMVTETCFNGQASVCTRKAVELIPGVWEVVYDWGPGRMDDLGVRAGVAYVPPSKPRITGMADAAKVLCEMRGLRKTPRNIVKALDLLSYLKET